MARTPGVELVMQALPGEYLLARAIFARLIEDVKAPRPRRVAHGSAGSTTVQDQLSAIEALVGDGIMEWAHLLNLDASYLRDHLLREAGLIDTTTSSQ
jgi:hypothetical protein